MAPLLNSAAMFFCVTEPSWQTLQLSGSCDRASSRSACAAECVRWQLRQPLPATVGAPSAGNGLMPPPFHVAGEIACDDSFHPTGSWQTRHIAPPGLSIRRNFPRLLSCGLWHVVHCSYLVLSSGSVFGRLPGSTRPGCFAASALS